MESQESAPPEIVNLVKWLRSSKSGVKTRVGIYDGKRVDYFKGKSALKALLSPAYAKLKNVPPAPADEPAATDLLGRLNRYSFFLRVERGQRSGGSQSPKHIQLIREQAFHPDFHFAWFYEGSQWTTYVGAVVMVAVIFAGVMFPLWPPILRQGAYYLSLVFFGLIGLFFATAIFRLIFWLGTIVFLSPGIWIFPNLFADVGFVDSFIPGWDWDLPPKKKGRKKKEDKGEKGKKSKKSKDGDAIGTTTALEEKPSGDGPKIEEVSDEGDD